MNFMVSHGSISNWIFHIDTLFFNDLNNVHFTTFATHTDKTYQFFYVLLPWHGPNMNTHPACASAVNEPSEIYAVEALTKVKYASVCVCVCCVRICLLSVWPHLKKKPLLRVLTKCHSPRACVYIMLIMEHILATHWRRCAIYFIVKYIHFFLLSFWIETIHHQYKTYVSHRFQEKLSGDTFSYGTIYFFFGSSLSLSPPLHLFLASVSVFFLQHFYLLAFYACHWATFGNAIKTGDLW